MGEIRKLEQQQSSSNNEVKNSRKRFKKSHPTSSKGKKAGEKKQGNDGSRDKTKNNKTNGSSSTSGGDSTEKWSKSKKKRMRKIMAKLKREQSNNSKGTGKGDGNPKKATRDDDATKSQEPKETTTTTEPDSKPKTNSKKNNNSIQQAFKARLAGSRFRILNEELYTTTSQKSYDKFREHPELFEQYHQGFRHQVESWPQNPVDVIVKSLTNKYQKKSKKATSRVVVADFGCGDAQLAKDLLAVKPKTAKASDNKMFKVHSFDLVSPNELVTACDMANVPLPDKSVDVCVFCLSLMGTNLADFIREAHRVLKDDGRVKIAEVRSRIEYSHSRSGTKKAKGNKEEQTKEKTEGTLEEFTDVLEKLGFECLQTDRTNKMFLLLELKKNGKKVDRKLEFSAKPCIYKRR